MTESFIVINVASIPLLNSLVKWGKETMSRRGYGTANSSQQGYGTSGISQNQVIVQRSWTVERENTVDTERLSKKASTESV